MIDAAVAALEKAYDLENAVMGQEQMRHLAETDPLTNCFNRRALMEKLEQEMDRAARYATMLTGMMIDIDNFKQINDTHGHLVGDRVLKQLASLLKREQRSVDIVARYGGEEFVVLLPETTSAESRNFAERILRRVATHDFGEPGKPVRVTISVGIASYPDERVTDGESLLAPGRQPPLPRQERRPEPVPRLSIRRCPRCQATYPAPARYCVKDGVSAGRSRSRPPRFAPKPTPPPIRPAPPTEPLRGLITEDLSSRPRRCDRCATLSGKLLDRRYQVGQRLGEGGMSYVYRAQDDRDGRHGGGQDPAAPALARSRPRSSGCGARRRSRRGWIIRTSVPSCGWARRTGMIYLVMPYLEGEPLSEHETRRGPISLAEGVPLLVQMCRGLAARARAADHPPRSQARERHAGARRHHGARASPSTAPWSWTSAWPRSGAPGRRSPS